MKKLSIALVCLLIICSCQSQVTPEIVSASDWQADLRHLQHTVHKEYSFLFKKVTAKDFDKAVDDLHTSIPKLQPHEIVTGFRRIVAMFKYGHTDVGWHESPVPHHAVPLNVYWFSDGVMVEGAHKDYKDLLGAKLVTVEGMGIDQVLQKLRAVAPAENDQYFKAYSLDLLLSPEVLHAQGITGSLGSSVKFGFEKDGKTFTRSIPATPSMRFPRQYGFVLGDSRDWVSGREQAATPHYLKNLDRIYYYEYLPASKTLYVRQSQILDDEKESIPDFYKKVFEFIDNNEVDKLVLDVRLNGGGNNYKNKPIVTGILASKKINKPGKLFVIVGRRTFSACQNLVNELSNYTNAVFVGEPTAENINFYGDTRRVVLPKSKMPVFLSFAWWQDKPQWENADWLAPQLAVDLSSKQYFNNEDPALQACLDFTDNDIVLDPMAHLKDLFMAGKLEEVEKEARKMTADPRYRYVDFESNINRSGYNLINAGQVESALFVFQLNTKLYPQSANTWDSLAEAFWRSNKTEKAVEYYNKAISLDPNGATGANARNMLKQISEGKKAF